MVAQVHHEVVVDLELVGHRVVERPEEHVLEAELAHERQDLQLLVERLADARSDRIFAQREVDEEGVDFRQA